MKDFSLDLRSLSNRKLSVIIREAQKSVLYCSNCHKEAHDPDCKFDHQLQHQPESGEA